MGSGLGAITITGCIEHLSDEPDSTEDDAAMSDNDDEEDAPDGRGNIDGEATGGTVVRDTRFEVLDVAGSEYDLRATVEFEDDRVVVEGTISGNNSCYTARVHDITVEDGTIIAEIESFDDSDSDEGCLEIIVGITYKLEFSIDGDPPSEVTVRHNEDHITTAHP